MMGSSAKEQETVKATGWDATDEPEHTVKLTNGFWLAETECTQGQWQAVMATSLLQQANKALNDDTILDLGGKKQTMRDFLGAKKGEGNKFIGVESESVCMYHISWEEADEFCNKASRYAGMRGCIITLPTEAQWEYACRAGTFGMTYAGDFKIEGANNAPSLDDIAWYGGNSSQSYTGNGWNTEKWKEKQYPGGTAGPRRVGTKKANAWGLKDMLGNVSEWCADYYRSNPTVATDPTGPASGIHRVLRGSAWLDRSVNCRAANRVSDAPGSRHYTIGFRPALVPVK